MAKGIEISCDEMVTILGDQEYHHREGETITLRPTLPLGLDRLVTDFRHDIVNLQDSPSEEKTDAVYQQMRDIVCELVLDWTWTDMKGDVLPLPAEDEDVIDREMSAQDVLWILARYSVVQAKATEEKKDGS